MKNLLPIYYQIKETIKNRILNKEYCAGQRIPSVEKLAEQFKVNHLTVRQAIGHLEQEGFLVSKRGSGTYVSIDETLKNSLSMEITGFMDEIFYQVQKAKTKSAEMNIIQAPAVIAEKLKLKPKKRTVLELKRMRHLQNNPFNYSINFIPMEIGSKIVKEELFQKPLLQILEQDLKIEFAEAVQFIQATFAGKEVADRLEVPAGSPTLFVERILYTKNHKPIQMLQAYYRGDLFKYIVRLKNIRQKNRNVWIHQDKLKP
ncbi:MAG: GntR family transcriptional regulator [Thermodesulfobacteriota bacterium]